MQLNRPRPGVDVGVVVREVVVVSDEVRLEVSVVEVEEVGVEVTVVVVVSVVVAVVV